MPVGYESVCGFHLCIVFPDDPDITLMNPHEYVAVQVTSSMQEVGYEERPVSQSTQIIGAIAECRVAFDMVFSPTHVYRALDVFQLAQVSGRWWIVSIISDMLR